MLGIVHLKAIIFFSLIVFCGLASVLAVITHPVPYCLSKGIIVWVIPGKNCPQCGTPCA